jgi:hypothetical protein
LIRIKAVKDMNLTMLVKTRRRRKSKKRYKKIRMINRRKYAFSSVNHIKLVPTVRLSLSQPLHPLVKEMGFPCKYLDQNIPPPPPPTIVCIPGNS